MSVCRHRPPLSVCCLLFASLQGPSVDTAVSEVAKEVYVLSPVVDGWGLVRDTSRLSP